MSELENAAKQDLIGLIDGSVPVEQSMAVARWAVKTAYTFTLATDPPIGRVPQRHMLHLKTNNDIAAGVRVFARVDQESDWWFSSTSTFVVEVEQPAPENAQMLVQQHYHNSYRYFLRLGRLTLVIQFWPSSWDPIGYNEQLLSLLGSNGKVYAFTDNDFEGFPDPHPLYDLAIRSSRCHLSFEQRQPGDLCLCGSGIVTDVCKLQDHPKNTAGNWGFI